MTKLRFQHYVALAGIGVFVAYLIACGRTGGLEVGTGEMSVRRPPDPLLSAVRCGTPKAYHESDKALSLDTANLMPSCSIVSGTIGGASRKDDYFRIDLPGGKDGRLRLTVVEYRADWAPTLALYDASKKKIATGKFTEPGTSRFVWENRVEAGRTYYYVLKDDVATRTNYRLLTEFFPE